jgi:DNA polymerase-3 subunit gamma/tau
MYYRKYRSQTIAEIDNSEIRETLGKSLLENKFSQAYLLVGTRGSGKTSMARLIAKVVNCTGRKLGEEPCNKCESCVAITDGRSLDVVEIDAASNTGVDDIRDLREKVKLAPVQGKFKIYIIDEVHMLSTSAFNALLKTLEEPPEHVIFVLATTDPQKLPETIVSRCLVYDFKTASKEELVRSLSRVVAGEKIKVDNNGDHTFFEMQNLIGFKQNDAISDAREADFYQNLNSRKLDILFVAFGHVKQEKWISKNLSKTNVSVMLGVGGAFDYLSGEVSRAPKWLRIIGFEWLYRLILQPWRVFRFGSLVRFIFLVLFKK